MSVSKAFRPRLSHPYYFIRKGLYRKIKEHAPSLRGRLLDFGCGSKPYQSLFVNVTEYIGVDFNSAGHAHDDEPVDFFYDGKTLPFGNAEFDAIFSSEVFEHIFNLDEIMPELHRVLKPGGKMLVTCPFVWNEHEVPVDFARYTRFALQDIFEKNGFSLLLADKSGDFTMAVYQMKMVFLNEHLIPAVPLLGKLKFFRTNLPPLINPLMNSWYSFLHWLLPKRKDLYLNNIVLAEKL